MNPARIHDLRVFPGLMLMSLAGWLGLLDLVNAAPASAKNITAGKALAQELIQMRPTENSSVTGVLKIRDAQGRRTEIPVSLKVVTGAQTWRSIYEAQAGDSNHVFHLTVVRSNGQQPQYEFTRPPADGSKSAAPSHLTGNQANVAFAASDFWLADLGLEFLYWPEQRLLKKELRRSQSCNVLESVNPNPGPGGYARVVSWIDIDTGGIVFAEAYDQSGGKLKQFKPDKFEKVNGRWQVKEIEIRNLKTGSRTKLEFNSETR